MCDSSGKYAQLLRLMEDLQQVLSSIFPEECEFRCSPMTLSIVLLMKMLYKSLGLAEKRRHCPTFLELMVDLERCCGHSSHQSFFLCSIHSFVCVTLRMEPRPSCMPGKCSATELHAHSRVSNVRSGAACTECQRVMVQMVCVFQRLVDLNLKKTASWSVSDT